jgi:hypothetical protein
LNLVAAFEDQKIEGLRQFVLVAWMEMTANSEFARNTSIKARPPPQASAVARRSGQTFSRCPPGFERDMAGRLISDLLLNHPHP